MCDCERYSVIGVRILAYLMMFTNLQVAVTMIGEQSVGKARASSSRVSRRVRGHFSKGYLTVGHATSSVVEESCRAWG